MRRKWKDATSYSRNEVGQRVPRTWELQGRNLRVIVHRHMDYPGKWLVSCYDVGMEKRELNAEDHETAKLEALGMVKSKLILMLEDVR